jgi:hypothetical protein
MMKSLHRYRALSAADRWLVIEAAVLLAAVRLGIAGVRISVLRPALHRSLRVITPHWGGKRVPSVSRLAWSVAAASRHLPFRSTCLVESLAADAMLRRRGYASEIRFGVRPPRGGALAGHAWVEHDGAVVFGALAELAEYSVLSTRAAE